MTAARLWTTRRAKVAQVTRGRGFRYQVFWILARPAGHWKERSSADIAVRSRASTRFCRDR